ncbi:hypothetical protein ABSA28_00642 [Candidatus Hepatincolaceae symbiont of Richtersius coronifer]
MLISKNIAIILLVNTFLLVLGNFIYTLDIDLIGKVLVSELCFIILYTLIDKGNLAYGTTFTVLSILVTLQFLLPVYSFLFFSRYVQIASVIISSWAILINSMMIRKMVNKGLTKIFSSRMSTITATILEIFLFAVLLKIGVIGALMTMSVRALYIYIVPKIIFKKPYLQSPY